MKIPSDIRGATTGFVVLLSKGLIDDKRWNWDLEKCDWLRYRAGFSDPSVLKTTMAVFMNSLEIDESGKVINWSDASFRGFQYFRTQVDLTYPFTLIQPRFSLEEMEEPDWRIWEDR
jgi:hypothetical protein